MRVVDERVAEGPAHAAELVVKWVASAHDVVPFTGPVASGQNPDPAVSHAVHQCAPKRAHAASNVVAKSLPLPEHVAGTVAKVPRGGRTVGEHSAPATQVPPAQC